MSWCYEFKWHPEQVDALMWDDALAFADCIDDLQAQREKASRGAK